MRSSFTCWGSRKRTSARALTRWRRTRTRAVLTPGTRMAASRSRSAAPSRSREARSPGAGSAGAASGVGRGEGHDDQPDAERGGHGGPREHPHVVQGAGGQFVGQVPSPGCRRASRPYGDDVEQRRDRRHENHRGDQRGRNAARGPRAVGAVPSVVLARRQVRRKGRVVFGWTGLCRLPRLLKLLRHRHAGMARGWRGAACGRVRVGCHSGPPFCAACPAARAAWRLIGPVPGSRWRRSAAAGR